MMQLITGKKVILIDSKSLQAMQHLLGTGAPRRLTSFLNSLESIDNVEIRFSGGLPFKSPHYPVWKRRMLRRVANAVPRLFTHLCHDLTSKELAECALLIITTRWRLTPYSHEEIGAIRDFVVRGGSLWLMANHSRVPGTRMGDFTTQDSRLAAALGIELLEGCFQMPEGLCELSFPANVFHPDDPGEENESQSRKVCINNAALISVRGVDPLILSDGSMIDRGPNGLSPKSHGFAVTKRLAGGHVLMTGDSGFVCEPDVPGTGPGLLYKGDNRIFVIEAIRWLLEMS